MAAASSVLLFFPRKGLASDLPLFSFFAVLFINCHCRVDFTSGAAGSLKTSGRGSVGMLDLGGGSTQITFLPRLEVTSPHPQSCLPCWGAIAPWRPVSSASLLRVITHSESCLV